jgi:tetratricopeptide (TPR) repeat protein
MYPLLYYDIIANINMFYTAQRMHANFKLGFIFYMMGRTHDAVEVYDTILDTQLITAKEQADALYHKGISLHMMGQINDAMVTFRGALVMDPDYLACYRYL